MRRIKAGKTYWNHKHINEENCIKPRKKVKEDSLWVALKRYVTIFLTGFKTFNSQKIQFESQLRHTGESDAKTEWTVEKFRNNAR